MPTVLLEDALPAPGVVANAAMLVHRQKTIGVLTTPWDVCSAAVEQQVGMRLLVNLLRLFGYCMKPNKLLIVSLESGGATLKGFGTPQRKKHQETRKHSGIACR